MYDTVHLYKNAYNNFVNKENFISQHLILMENFISILVNVRNPEHGRRKEDHTRYPIYKDERHDILSYLIKVHEWLQHWHDDYGAKQGFSKETFNAIIQTTKGIPHLVDYLLDIKELDYVLLGFIQSDYREQRFGWYRQLCGVSYFNSVLQLLQPEKSIRIRSLLDMNSIKKIFHEQNKCKNRCRYPFIVGRNRWIRI